MAPFIYKERIQAPGFRLLAEDESCATERMIAEDKMLLRGLV